MTIISANTQKDNTFKWTSEHKVLSWPIGMSLKSMWIACENIRAKQ